MQGRYENITKVDWMVTEISQVNSGFGGSSAVPEVVKNSFYMME